MERHWKQREKEIERVVKNTVGLYGDMQGILLGDIWRYFRYTWRIPQTSIPGTGSLYH